MGSRPKVGGIANRGEWPPEVFLSSRKPTKPSPDRPPRTLRANSVPPSSIKRSDRPPLPIPLCFYLSLSLLTS